MYPEKSMRMENTRCRSMQTHRQTRAHRLRRAIKSVEGQTAGLSVCMCIVTMSVWVCLSVCLAAKLFMWLTLEQIKGDASFLGMWTPAKAHLPPQKSPINIHRPSITQHNQLRSQWLMWTDKSRKWIWKPPALCHIPLHSTTDKQDASPFCLTAPFAVFSFSPCLTSIWLVQKMWVELTAAAVVLPLSTHANLNKLMSGWVNARICLGAVGGLMGRSVCSYSVCAPCVCVCFSRP